MLEVEETRSGMVEGLAKCLALRSGGPELELVARMVPGR